MVDFKAETGTISTNSPNLSRFAMLLSKSPFDKVSILFNASTIRFFLSDNIWRICWSSGCKTEKQSLSSEFWEYGWTIHKIKSVSHKVFSAYATIFLFSMFSVLCIPGVSIKIIWVSFSVRIPRMRFLVVWALWVVMEIFCPTSLFSNVDLPTLGRPTRHTNPQNCFASFFFYFVQVPKEKYFLNYLYI